LVGSRKRILSRTKLATDLQTTGVSPKRLDNADDVIHGLPDISNNVGPVKLFLRTLLRSLRRVCSLVFFDLCIDDHGSFVI
jgi:hypothetical protein